METGPATQSGTISTIGIEFDQWNERQGINTDNGAVFFMDPLHGATTEPVIFAQLTVPAGERRPRPWHIGTARSLMLRNSRRFVLDANLQPARPASPDTDAARGVQALASQARSLRRASPPAAARTGPRPKWVSHRPVPRAAARARPSAAATS